jgi:small subunit ribosomal protein S10
MQKIRVKIEGYDHRVVDQAVQSILDTALRTGAKVSGPIPLPNRIKKYSVIRGPHIDKRSMEQFEMRIHKRVIEILDPTSKTIDSMMHLQVPSGVGIEIK